MCFWRGLHSHRQRYASSEVTENVVESRVIESTTSVMMRIVVDKSTDHAKPQSICLLP